MLQGNIPQQAEQYAKKREHRKVWHRIVMVLACIVVFCTTYALILPAITMERAPSCGFEEHQHTEGCYEVRQICGFDESQTTAHAHSESCYDHQQILVCGREESLGHIHSDSCIYTEQSLICAQEHEHAPECFASSSTFVCGMAEGEGAHAHSQECYETYDSLICTIPEQPLHVHTDACYKTELVCQRAEHLHSDACYPSSVEETTEAPEVTTEATVETTGAIEETTEAIEEITEETTEETTEATTEETTEATEETTEETSEATEEETQPEVFEVPELEPYVIATTFTDTVYDAAADHFDTVMNVSFRIPVSVISVGELYECNYQLPGKLSPRADLMWSASNFHFGAAYSSSASRAGTFTFTYEGNHCLCVLDFDRNAVTGDVVEGNFRFAAEISRNALQEDGTILLILSNGVGVSIPAPEMPAPETEPTEMTTEATEETTEATEETTEATEETTEATEETTEAIEETTEATEETTEATEETTEATEETTEATEETTEPTVGNIKDAILGFIGDKLQMDGSGMGSSGYEMTNGTDETEATEETTGDGGIMPLVGTDLPVTKISGLNTEYDPVTEQFTSDVRIDFQFTATTGKPTAGTVYTYTYPAGMVVPDDVVNKGSQALYDGTKYAGTYQFIKNSDSTYSVQIIFNEQYISESGDTITGYVQFEGSFGKEAINEKGDIVVGGDSAVVLVPSKDISYPDNETESSQISVSKEGSWERDGDNLVYTVYVRTIKGTPNPISLEDIITIPDGLNLGQPAVTVQRGTATYHYRSWDKTWGVNDNNDLQEVSGVTSSYDDDSGKLTLSLPGLSGSKIDANNATGDYYKITYTYHIESQDDPIVTADNRVTVSATDSTKGQTVFDSDKTTVPVDKDYSHTLDKSGQVASDKPGYIKWTVTVNRNNVNIAGATLTDQMLGLVDNTQTDIQIYPAEYAIVKKDADGKITSITFPAINDGTNTNTFTITYYTPVEESWDGTTVSNTVTFDPTPGDGGDEKEVTATVTVSGVKLGKWGQFNGNTGKIDWTITVNSGGLDIAGATLTDEMFAALTDTDFSITPEGSGYTFNKDGEGKITGITFTAGEDGKNIQTYKITYSTAVTKNENGSTSAVTNTATLSPGSGVDGKPIESESTVKPDELQLTKSGSYDSYNQRINWTINVNASKLNIAGAVLTDEMLSQLTVDGITVKKDWNTVSPGAEGCGFTFETGSDGKITSIAFTATENGKNNSYYVITYSTPALQEWNERTVHNEAKLTLDGKEIPGTADVKVPASGSIAKSAGTGAVSEDGKTMTIPWTVTLNVPQGGLPAGTTIVDDVTKNHYSNTNTNQWMTRAQITAWATNLTWMDDNGNTVGGNNSYTVPPEQITFLASDGNTYTYKQISEYQATAGEGEVNYGNLIYKLFTIHFPNGLIPPEGATKLTFTYSTTVDLTQTGDGVTKFYNYVNAGGKEESAEYPYYKPYVVKTDGNGYTSETTVSNEGELTWKIKATVGQGNTKLILTDTLPEGVTLESLQLTGWDNLNMALSVAEDGTISGTDSTKQYAVTGTYSGNAITVNIARLNEGDAIKSGAEFTLTVNCKVTNAGSQSGTMTLTNHVDMRLDNQTADDTPIDSSDQTQKWTYDRQVVDKSGAWDNDNRIMNYTVILNPDGKDLVEGVDTLTLVDTMKYRNQVSLEWPFSGTYNIDAALIQGSVKLYEASWDGAQWVAGRAVTGWSWTYETKITNDWENVTNTITATGIPDGTPLILRYSYRITSNVPDKQDGKDVYFNLYFSNKAMLEGTGHSDSSSSNSWKWEHSSSSAGVTTDKSYTFYKVEAGNYNVSIAGAKFSVYKYDNGSYGETAVKTYTTDSSGSFHITRQEKDASGNVTFTYDSNTLYKVVETAAPTGYWMPDVVNTYYFYFSSETDNTYTLPTDLPAGAVDLSSEAKTVYVENVKNTTEISVEKVWKDASGKDETASHSTDKIQLKLYQRIGTGSNVGTGDGNSYSFTVKRSDNTILTDSVIKPGGTVAHISFTDTWGKDYTSLGKVTVNGVNVTCQKTENGNEATYTLDVVISQDTSVEISFSNAGNWKDYTVDYTLPSSPTDPDSGDSEDTQVQTITLPDSDGNWSHTFTDLPLKGSVNGNTVSYYYYFQEAEVPDGYSVSYSNGPSGVQSGTVTVTNQKLPESTSVTVKKVWKDANGNQITSDSEDYTSLPTSIQVYLTRTAGETTERVDSNGNTGDSAQPYTVTKEAGWTLTIAELPRTGGDGNAYTYSFEEVTVEGYTSKVTASGNTTTITNTKPPSGTSLTVEKRWADANSNPIENPAYSVQLKLHQALNNAEVSNPTWGSDIQSTVKLPNNGKWTYTWQNLPASDGNGGTYTYYVTEDWVHQGESTDDLKYNFACFYTDGKGGDAKNAVEVNSKIIMTNELLGPGKRATAVTAQKSWMDAQGNSLSNPNVDSVQLQLHQVKHTPTKVTVLDDKQQTENGTLTILNGCDFDDPSLFLRITINVTDGEFQHYVGGTLCDYRWKAYSDLGIPSSATTGDNYRYFSLQELKNVANGLTLNYWGGSYSSLVCAEVVRVDSSTTENSTYGQPVTVKAGNDWKAQWDGVPTVDVRTGEYYTYYVEETAVDGYTTTYQVGNQTYGAASDAAVDPYGTITVTNKKQPETTSITVQKKWVDSSGNAMTSPQDSITFDLYQLASGETSTDGKTPILSGLTVKAQSADGEVKNGYAVTYGSWTTTISNLPKTGTGSNNQTVTYTYYVVETAPEGYEVSYSNGSTTSETGSSVTAGDNGTITITNTKTTTPGGTSLTVKKEWNGVENPTDEVTFDLYRKETAASAYATRNGSTEYTLTYNIVKGNSNSNNGILSDTKQYVNGAQVRFVISATGDYSWLTVSLQCNGSNVATTRSTTQNENGGVASTTYVSDVITINSDTEVLSYLNNWDNVWSCYVDVVYEPSGGGTDPTEPSTEPTDPSEPSGEETEPVTTKLLEGLKIKPNGTGSETIGSYTVTYGNLQTTILNLPQTGTNSDGQAVTYTYYVVETAPDGYQVTYSNGTTTSSTGSEVTTDAGGALTITNAKTTVPAAMSVSVRKSWLNEDGKAMTEVPYSATVKLKRVKAQAIKTYENKATLETKYMTSQYKLIVSFNLDDATKAASCPGSICCGDNWDDHLAYFVFSSDAVGTNYCVFNMADFANKSTDVRINFWGDYEKYATLNSCTLVKLPDTPEWEFCGNPVVLDGTTTQYTWSGLDRTASDGSYWIYTVEETEVKQGDTVVTDWFNTTVDPSSGLCTSGTITITNTKVAELTVKKEWKKADSTALTPGNAYSATVQLYQVATTGGTTEKTEKAYGDSPVTLDYSNNWEYTWYNLPANDGNTTYTYYVQEVSMSNGGEENFADLFNVTVDHGNQNNAVGPSGTVTVTNTLKSTFILPETGGGGAKPYTLGGLLLCFTAGALLLYSHSRRGKEDATSS